MAWKKAHQLISATGLSPSRRRAERWVCSWCLPTLGPCLPNIYERDPVIIRQAFRRKHFESRSRGGERGDAASLPPSVPSGICPSLQHHLAGPPRVPGAGDSGETSGGLTKERGYVWLCGCNFPRLVPAPLAHGHGRTPGLSGAPARLLLPFCTSWENRCAYFCFGFPICVTHVTVE